MPVVMPSVDALSQLIRPNRILIGWLDPDQVTKIFAGPDLNTFRQKAQDARSIVAGRPVNINQTDALTPAPTTLDEHVASLRAIPSNLFDNGGNIQIADLRRIIAAQPLVFSDHAQERVANLNPNNIRDVAAVTIPIPIPKIAMGNYDEVRKTFIFTSPDPNLQVLQVINQNGVCGFQVALATSIMRVGRFNNRLYLLDGYHRAFGLLKREIYFVPVVVNEFTQFEHMRLPQGMLLQDAYLGNRPPWLSDYLDDEVAVSHVSPASQKLVIIQATELSAIR